MAISGQYSFHAGTAAAFAEAKAQSKIVAQDLYFLTDTKELFIGEDKYCNPVEFVTEDVAAANAVVGVLYVNTVTHKVTSLNGEAMVEVAPQIVSSIAADTAEGAVANVGAIKTYVSGQVGELGNPVKTADYDSAAQKITLTYNDDTTKELLLKDLITGVEYDGTTGKFTFSRANNATAIEVSTPVENFLSAAAIDEATHVLTLTLQGGQTVTVDLTQLVDVYTVDDTATVDMTMNNGKITADVKVSAETGNAVVAKTDGIFVAIPKDYIQSIEDGKAIDLDVDANGKLKAEAKASAGVGNKVQIAEDGLFVAADYIGSIEDTATIDLDVTSAKLKGTVKLSAKENNAITAETDGLHVNISGKADKATTLAGYGIGDAYTKEEVNTELGKKQNNLSEAQLAAANSGITAAKREGYDAHVGNADIHVTAEQKTAWTAKQNALSETQMAAVDSGITAAKVAAYDAYETSKQAALSEAQMNAVNSGITAEKLATCEAKQDALTADQLAAVNSGITAEKLATCEAKQDALTTAQLAAVNSGIDATAKAGYDTHIANTTVHITAEERAAWNAKQNALSEAQLAACNSGITAEKVAAYDLLDGAKANKATTLAGYGIADAYTKTEVNTLLTWKTI